MNTERRDGLPLVWLFGINTSLSSAETQGNRVCVLETLCGALEQVITGLSRHIGTAVGVDFGFWKSHHYVSLSMGVGVAHLTLPSLPLAQAEFGFSLPAHIPSPFGWLSSATLPSNHWVLFSIGSQSSTIYSDGRWSGLGSLTFSVLRRPIVPSVIYFLSFFFMLFYCQADPFTCVNRSLTVLVPPFYSFLI